MSKSIYKEKILERLRIIHEEERMLYDILDAARGVTRVLTDEKVKVEEVEK